ncbi:hypothetical protein D3C87_2129610 [compost metagenome]
MANDLAIDCGFLGINHYKITRHAVHELDALAIPLHVLRLKRKSFSSNGRFVVLVDQEDAPW